MDKYFRLEQTNQFTKLVLLTFQTQTPKHSKQNLTHTSGFVFRLNLSIIIILDYMEVYKS